MVEVDALDLGIRSVLCQKLVVREKLHPSAFHSLKLSPSERKYDVGNRELLAKVNLEEWQHWLEGKAQLFLVWTDHNNLRHLKTPN